MNSNKELLDKVYDLYIKEKIGFNSICQECKSYSERQGFKLFNGPVPIFHIGKDFGLQKTNLLIVGKVAYGWDDKFNDFDEIWTKAINGDKKATEIIQETIENRVQELFFSRITTYFSFLEFALSNIFGSAEKAFRSVAITNFVHCNDGSIYDSLRQKVRYYCASLDANGFIHKEIEILRPSHILVLSNSIQRKYERYIENTNLNVKFIEHPSSPGRSKNDFTNEIKMFLKE